MSWKNYFFLSKHEIQEYFKEYIEKLTNSFSQLIEKQLSNHTAFHKQTSRSLSDIEQKIEGLNSELKEIKSLLLKQVNEKKQHESPNSKGNIDTHSSTNENREPEILISKDECISVQAVCNEKENLEVVDGGLCYSPILIQVGEMLTTCNELDKITNTHKPITLKQVVIAHQEHPLWQQMYNFYIAEFFKGYANNIILSSISDLADEFASNTEISRDIVFAVFKDLDAYIRCFKESHRVSQVCFPVKRLENINQIMEAEFRIPELKNNLQLKKHNTTWDVLKTKLIKCNPKPGDNNKIDYGTEDLDSEVGRYFRNLDNVFECDPLLFTESLCVNLPYIPEFNNISYSLEDIKAELNLLKENVESLDHQTLTYNLFIIETKLKNLKLNLEK